MASDHLTNADSEKVPPYTMRRLMQEFKLHQAIYEEHRENGTLSEIQFRLVPDPKRFLRWHFLIFNLPADCPFSKGFYRGLIDFPKDYPWSPPSIQMTTPNGRFMTQMKICLSMTSYHPRSWNPMWRAETIVMGLISFMLCPDDKTGDFVGHTCTTDDHRRQLATKSMEFNLKMKDFRELFPEFVPTPYTNPSGPSRL